MFYSTDWHDFVIYPLKPELGDTQASRLDISNAFRKDSSGKLPPNYSANSERGLVIQKDDIERDGDIFAAMLINDFGNVIVWTSRNLWSVIRTAQSGSIEKLQYVPLDHTELS